MFRIFMKVSVALAVLLAVSILVLALPARRLWRLRGDLQVKSEQLLSDTALLAEFRDPDTELKTSEKQLRNLDEKFPAMQGVPFVLQQLGDKSRELGLEILSMNPMEEEALAPGALPATYAKKKILLELKCEYQTLGQYVATIANLPTFFSVEELVLASPAINTPMLNVRLVLAFYVRKPGA